MAVMRAEVACFVHENEYSIIPLALCPVSQIMQQCFAESTVAVWMTCKEAFPISLLQNASPKRPNMFPQKKTAQC